MPPVPTVQPFTGDSSQCSRHRLNPWVRTRPWRGHGSPLQCSCLERPMDRGAWRATVHRVTESDTTAQHTLARSSGKKTKQRHQRWRGRGKSPFTSASVLHIEDLLNPQKIIRVKFCRLQDTRSMHKITSLSIYLQWAVQKLNKIIPFTIVPKGTECRRITLIKEVGKKMCTLKITNTTERNSRWSKQLEEVLCSWTVNVV